MITDKEKILIQEILKGKTNKEIAHQLHYSKRTIEGIRMALINKLNCKSLYEVIGVCFRKKWIE